MAVEFVIIYHLHVYPMLKYVCVCCVWFVLNIYSIVYKLSLIHI